MDDTFSALQAIIGSDDSVRLKRIMGEIEVSDFFALKSIIREISADNFVALQAGIKNTSADDFERFKASIKNTSAADFESLQAFFAASSIVIIMASWGMCFFQLPTIVSVGVVCFFMAAYCMKPMVSSVAENGCHYNSKFSDSMALCLSMFTGFLLPIFIPLVPPWVVGGGVCNRFYGIFFFITGP